MPVYTLPSDRTVSWNPGVNVGVIGGIPTNRTNLINVTQSPYNADNTGVIDATAAIQSALSAAVDNDIVYLPAGTYKITNVLAISQNDNNITLRGDGMGVTVLSCTGTRGYGLTVNVDSIAGDFTVTSSPTKGATTITISSTSNFSANSLALITVQNQQTDSSIQNGAVPVVHDKGSNYVRAQLTRVVSKTATDLTIFPALYWDSTGLTVKVNYTTSQINGVGIENLTLDLTSGTVGAGIYFNQCYGCWIKNVRIIQAVNYCIEMDNSLNCEIRGSYLDQIKNAGSNGAGLLFYLRTSACLIEDNIIYKSFPNMEINGGSCGNVFGYNFCYDSTTAGEVGAAIDTNHGPHNSFNLYEGNVAANIQCDGYFGSASEDTVYRNWLTSTSPGASSREPILLQRMTRNYTVVANQLGTPNIPIRQIFGTIVNTPYSFGLPNMGGVGFASTAQPSSGDFWGDWGLTGALLTRVSNTSGTVTLPSGIGSLVNTLAQPGISWSGGSSSRSNITLAINGTTVAFGAGAGTSLPAVGEPMRFWPGPEGFQERDMDVFPTYSGGSTTLLGNYNTVITGVPSNEEIGSYTFSDSFYITGGRPSWFGFLSWPPFSPTSPNFATGSTIPAAYRWFNGRDPFYVNRRLGARLKFKGLARY